RSERLGGRRQEVGLRDHEGNNGCCDRVERTTRGPEKRRAHRKLNDTDVETRNPGKRTEEELGCCEEAKRAVCEEHVPSEDETVVSGEVQAGVPGRIESGRRV